MQTKSLPSTFDAAAFVAEVGAMRAKQREYFRTRSRDVLAEAKRLEGHVDRLLDEASDPQVRLFDPEDSQS